MNKWRTWVIGCIQLKIKRKIKISLSGYFVFCTVFVIGFFNFLSPINNFFSFLPDFETKKAEAAADEEQDFFIQRGTVFVSGTSTTLIAGVDYAVPTSTDSAFIRITNTQITGAGRSTGDSTQNANDVSVYIENPENIDDSVTIARPSGAINDTRVSWEIIEYVGLPGADNEIIIRDQGTISYGSGETSVNGAAVPSVLDDDNVVVFITGQSNENTGTNYYLGMSTADWNGTTSEPVIQRGDSGSVSNVSYAVVEFTGANWNVQRVEHTYTAAGTTETESISTVSSLSQTFLHTQKRIGNGESGLDELGHEVWLSSIGAVSFQLYSTVSTPSLHTTVVWVIENVKTGSGAMDVQRLNGVLATSTCSGAEPCAENITISSVDANNSSVWGNNVSAGTGTNYPSPMMGLRILSSGSEVEFWRSDTGQPQTFRVEVVEWPIAETIVRQNYYRFYVDNDSLDPVDPWPVGAVDLGENTSITSSDDPLGEGEVVRLRMTLQVSEASLPAGVSSFKLQYGLRDTTCSAISVWNDVGSLVSGAIWRGYDGSVSDGTNLATSTPAAGTLNISVSDVAGTYEEQNNSAANPYIVGIGEDVEYDWVLEHNGAAQRTDYCFRMTYDDGSELDSYIYYPTLRTNEYTPVLNSWQWFEDESSLTPVSPLASENVSPIDIENQSVQKLRLVATEIENATGNNVKFALQFSEYADFSDGGTFVISSSSCVENSLWCYADGAGIDNDLIDEKVLALADSCSGGIGLGCGTHNEAATTTSTFTHSALTSSEFEFTLRQAGARANAVYYFRPYDVNDNKPVSASSSYPSLVTEGAQLVSVLSGVNSGTTIAGITSDVNTTPTSISFGSLPVGTTQEAIQRLDISTNATEGYQVLMYGTQQLTNSYGDVIPAIISTNNAPLDWNSSCPESQSGCFGYHTTDATLAGGSGRFTPIDSYAALGSSPQEVMYSSVPINNSENIIYRVLIRENQPAGDYETSIVYIAIPTF